MSWQVGGWRTLDDVRARSDLPTEIWDCVIGQPCQTWVLVEGHAAYRTFTDGLTTPTKKMRSD